jgi:transglutaminase superfamily protein
VSRRVTRHLAALGAQLERPADVWLLVRMLAWSAVLPIGKRVLPLPRLVQLLLPRARARERDRRREAAIESLSEWVFKSRPPSVRDNCLERGLVAYRYLVRAGADPTLVVGMPRTPGGHGHVWVSVDGTPVHDSAEQLAQFEPVLAFASDGTLVLGDLAEPLLAGERERECRECRQ